MSSYEVEESCHGSCAGEASDHFLSSPSMRSSSVSHPETMASKAFNRAIRRPTLCMR